MARGWESKSVVDQVAEKAEASSNASSHQDHRARAVAQADRQRQQQALELQRERILDQRTSNPHRRAALEAALTDIEAQLRDLA